MSDNAATVQDRGFLWFREALAKDALDRLRKELFQDGVGTRVEVKDLRAHRVWDLLLERFPNHVPVRAVTFSKSDTQSWALPWHQDRVIALRERHSVQGFEKWTRKAGVWHCEAPMAVLSSMVFLGVFLDDVDAQSGGMEYAIGSHRKGRVEHSEANRIAHCFECAMEDADAGDILALPMLTLHRSGSAKRPATRRVLRIDLADTRLPPPLDWAD